MHRPTEIPRFLLAVLVWLSAAPALASSRPSVDFLGVYDATGNDVRSRDMEDRFADALRGMSGWRALMPSDLDGSSFGREARLQLLASRSPTSRLVASRNVLGDYALLVTIRPDDKSMDGPDITTVRLLRVGDGAEVFTRQYTVVDDDTLRSIVDDLDAVLDPAKASPVPETSLGHDTRLVFAPLRRTTANAPTVISAEAEGSGDVIASVIYRREEDAAWHVVDLIHGEGHRYVGALPPMPAGHVLYYLHVTDSELNELVTAGSEDRPYRLLLANPLPPLKQTAPPPDSRQELPPAAVNPSPSSSDPARPYTIGKWVTFSAALALAGGGLALGFTQHVLFFQPITEVQAAQNKPYQIPVGCMLGAAGALGIVSIGLWRIEVAHTPSGPAVVASSSF